jgi:hypothetical protein
MASPELAAWYQTQRSATPEYVSLLASIMETEDSGRAYRYHIEATRILKSNGGDVSPLKGIDENWIAGTAGLFLRKSAESRQQ